jgi:replicative DNA helicase
VSAAPASGPQLVNEEPRDRAPSEDAERATLSAMMLDASVVPGVLQELQEKHFSSPRCGRVFAALVALAARGLPILDPISLADELAQRGELAEIGGKDFIGALLDEATTSVNVLFHARIVRKHADDRALLRVFEEGAALVRAGQRGPADVAGSARQALEEIERSSASGIERLAAPISIRELIAAPEPTEQDIVEGFIPADANLLLAAYPKSHKTNLLLEIAVGAAAAQRVLGRFPVRRRHRVGLVLMEDRLHRARRRLRRLCEGHGITLEDLDGYLHLWFRPPLRLNDPAVMHEMRAHIERLELDLFWIDSWAYVAEGNSDKDDIVSPQLAALTRLRDCKPGLSAGLTHHARKTQGETSGQRLTDVIRNSSHFAAWYDAGLLLSRADETSPVMLRAELRDLPSFEPFAFRVEDQFPAVPERGLPPSGWLRLTACDASAATVAREAAAAKLVPAVQEYLAAHPGISKNKLRAAIGKQGADVDAAFDLLAASGVARFDPPERRGLAGQCWLNNGTSSGFVSGSSETHPERVSEVRLPPLRGGRTPLTSADGGETLALGETRFPALELGVGGKDAGDPGAGAEGVPA